MSKAKKGLIITLFAAMMVFAFGATSAFAAAGGGTPAPQWSKDFKTCTLGENVYSAKWTFGDDGMTTATITPTGSDGVIYSDGLVRYFYDFTGATIASADPIKYTTYVGLNGTDAYGKVTMKDPSGGSATKTIAKVASAVSLTFKTDTNLDEAGGKADINVEVKTNGEGKGLTEDDPAIFGTPIAAKSVTVNPTSANITKAWAAINGKDVLEQTDADTLTMYYDGNENQIVAKPQINYTIKYQVKDATTGKWSDVEAIKYQHAADPVTYRAKYVVIDDENDWMKNKTQELTLTVAGAKVKPGFKWAKGNATSYMQTADFLITAAQAADPAAFITFFNGFEDAAVADVDVETIKAFFNDVYSISDTARGTDASMHDWKVEAKTLTSNDMKAINKKYAQLIADYEYIAKAVKAGKYSDALVGDFSSIVVKITDADSSTVQKADDITFTMAPNKVTYKAKKLKKAKSFTVEAVAESGNAITYIMTSPSKKISIDPATGKVTVKKLKKGTYKVKIKAKTEAGNGYAAAKESVSVKIKVKK